MYYHKSVVFNLSGIFPTLTGFCMPDKLVALLMRPISSSNGIFASLGNFTWVLRLSICELSPFLLSMRKPVHNLNRPHFLPSHAPVWVFFPLYPCSTQVPNPIGASHQHNVCSARGNCCKAAIQSIAAALTGRLESSHTWSQQGRQDTLGGRENRMGTGRGITEWGGKGLGRGFTGGSGFGGKGKLKESRGKETGRGKFFQPQQVLLKNSGG